jgi:hypothetical protein
MTLGIMTLIIMDLIGTASINDVEMGTYLSMAGTRIS